VVALFHCIQNNTNSFHYQNTTINNQQLVVAFKLDICLINQNVCESMIADCEQDDSSQVVRGEK
jgi:hypothetical protein